MGLYLALFDDDNEIDGVEIGAYADFQAFREAVASNLEGGIWGSKFPVLMLHSDCDGQWLPREAASLEKELGIIGAQFCGLAPVPFNSDWKNQVANLFSINPKNLCDCFFDIDGEPLVERLAGLARLSQAKDLPILFQ